MPPLKIREGGVTGNTTKRLRRTTLTSIEIAELVLKSVLTRLVFRAIFRVFTYEERRGRESNPRMETYPRINPARVIFEERSSKPIWWTA
jgi:hypothetical protein